MRNAETGYREYMRNRRTSLGVTRVLRVLRWWLQSSPDRWLISHADDQTDLKTLHLFEVLNATNVLALERAGIDEERERADAEREKRGQPRRAASLDTSDMRKFRERAIAVVAHLLRNAPARAVSGWSLNGGTRRRPR